MNKLKLNFLTLFFLMSCTEQRTEYSYFPMQSGIIWEYNKFIFYKNKKNVYSTKKIFVENNSKYQRYTSFLYVNCIERAEPILKYHESKKYYRIDSEYNVYEMINSNFYILDENRDAIKKTINEQIKYKFSADLGETWEYIDIDENVRIEDNPVGMKCNVSLVSKIDTINISNRIIENCYKFHFSYPAGKDLDYYEWYSPNLGLIKSSSIYCNMGIELENLWVPNEI